MILYTKDKFTQNKTVGIGMNKGVKFRAYPNKEQQNLIKQSLGCCRLIYNKGLAMRNDAFAGGQIVGYTQTSAMLTDLKKQEGFAFLKDVDSIALQQSLRDLDRDFKNFFENVQDILSSKASMITISPTEPLTRATAYVLSANISDCQNSEW